MAQNRNNVRVVSLIAGGALFAGISILSAQSDPTVRVSGGEIRGQSLANGATFKGVPYAAPPVGDLRWRDPAPVKAWEGTRDATKYGAVCAQVGGQRNPAAFRGDEDCLFLNVWTPEWPVQSKLPVMVWFHGGGNMRGSSLGSAGIEPPFDGGPLSRHGVVMVTVNYRLGIFGFFSHPDLAGESPHRTSGNYALMDQIASLKWVRDNITRFGGDPGNVTIFGQSAGANDTGELLASPLSEGLFQRAIEESGTVIGNARFSMSRSTAEKIGRDIAAKMQAPSIGSLAYMRGLPTAEVLKDSPVYGSGLLGPSVDGYVITQNPALTFERGKEHRVPLIIGNNAREATFEGDSAALQKAMAELYGDLTARAQKLYSEVSHYAPYGEIGTQFGVDSSHRCPSITIARWHSSTGSPVYEYEFSHAFPESKIGASHSGELRYVFGVFPSGPTDNERKIADDMEAYWTNFARRGDPNGKGLPNWPRFDSSARGYIEFTDVGPAPKESLRRDYCDLFAQVVSTKLGH